jgi:hypothetical protein
MKKNEMQVQKMPFGDGGYAQGGSNEFHQSYGASSEPMPLDVMACAANIILESKF